MIKENRSKKSCKEREEKSKKIKVELNEKIGAISK